MKFTKEEIELARKLKQQGLDWQPSVGHFVWDEADIVKCEFPFHDMVFFILDVKHFLRRAETIENLQRDLCWLPTWYQAREVLSENAVSTERIIEKLRVERAIENGTERYCLYELIEECLS